MGSLSARRAWIEISRIIMSVLGLEVALRKESVDRNSLNVAVVPAEQWSLSARRAWIEIWARHRAAPRKWGRSPQGERG